MCALAHAGPVPLDEVDVAMVRGAIRVANSTSFTYEEFKYVLPHHAQIQSHVFEQTPWYASS